MYFETKTTIHTIVPRHKVPTACTPRDKVHENFMTRRYFSERKYAKKHDQKRSPRASERTS